MKLKRKSNKNMSTSIEVQLETIPRGRSTVFGIKYKPSSSTPVPRRARYNLSEMRRNLYPSSLRTYANRRALYEFLKALRNYRPSRYTRLGSFIAHWRDIRSVR